MDDNAASALSATMAQWGIIIPAAALLHAAPTPDSLSEGDINLMKRRLKELHPGADFSAAAIQKRQQFRQRAEAQIQRSERNVVKWKRQLVELTNLKVYDDAMDALKAEESIGESLAKFGAGSKRPREEADNCPNCQETIDTGVLSTLPCGHQLHTRCLNDMRNSSLDRRCPICRQCFQCVGVCTACQECHVHGGHVDHCSVGFEATHAAAAAPAAAQVPVPPAGAAPAAGAARTAAERELAAATRENRAAMAANRAANRAAQVPGEVGQPDTDDDEELPPYSPQSTGSAGSAGSADSLTRHMSNMGAGTA